MQVLFRFSDRYLRFITPPKGLLLYEVFTMELNKFKAFQRTNTKKNANRKLRNEGLVPAVLYGQGKDQVNLKLDPKKLVEALDPVKKRNTYLSLEVEGAETTNAIIRDVQFNVLNGDVTHVDFLRINPEDRITVTVPFKTIGRSAGESIGGRKRQIIREFSVTCPVATIPAEITYDVTPLKIDDIIRVENLEIPEGVTLNMNARQAVVSIETARGAAADEEEGEEGEEEGATEEAAE